MPTGVWIPETIHSRVPEAKDTRLTRRVLGLALGVFLIGYMLWRADISSVADSVRGLSLWPVLVTVLILYLSLPLRVIQWQLLLGMPSGLSFAQVFKALCLGYLGNGILPLGGGDVLKACVLADSARLSTARVLASVVLVRFQDLFPVLLLATVAAGTLPLSNKVEHDLQALLPSGIVFSKTQLAGAVHLVALSGVILTACLVAAYLCRKTLLMSVVKLVPRLSNRSSAWVQHALGQFSAGLGVIAGPKAFLAGQVVACLCWLIFTLAPIPLLMAFSLDFKQAATSALAVTGLATLGQLIPVAPGGLGTYHALCILAVVAFNPAMSRESAVAYALVSHVIGTVSPAVPGLFLLPGAWNQVQAARHTQRNRSKETI